MKKTIKFLSYPLALVTAIMLLAGCIHHVTLPLTPVNITVTDTDGNVYGTVKIGEQIWMAENLKTTHYRNGEPIGTCEDQFWGSQTSGVYCDYNDDPNNSAVYGKLYNGYAVLDSRNLAPVGWHVATDADWNALANYLGTGAGDKLKEAGNIHWLSPYNVGATNSTGFTALPGGYRDNYSLPQGMHPTTYIGFNDIGNVGFWWTSTAGAPNTPHYETALLRSLHSYNNSLSGNEYLQSYGMSVRCIKD